MTALIELSSRNGVAASDEEWSEVCRALNFLVDHDVRSDVSLPGAEWPIDHLIVGPGGVLVIGVEWGSGLVEVRPTRSLLHRDSRLYVGADDWTPVVDRVAEQVGAVRLALGADLADVPVHGALCLVGFQWGWIKERKWVHDVLVHWPSELANRLARPPHVTDRAIDAARRLRELSTMPLAV